MQSISESLNINEDNNRLNILNGLYGNFIKENDDGTFIVDDGILRKTLKIEKDNVYFLNNRYGMLPEWIESIPIISIKDRRHEQLFFENRTQLESIDSVFKSPDYFNVAKGVIVDLLYMKPIDYMLIVAEKFKSTLGGQIEQLSVRLIKKYSNDMLNGDLFPLPMIEFYKDGTIDQEGRHRVMAIQHLIDIGKISNNTEIPVIVKEYKSDY